MFNKINRIILAFLVVCVIQAQNPASAFNFKFPFFKKNKAKQETKIPENIEPAPIQPDLTEETPVLDDTADENAETPAVHTEEYIDEDNLVYIKQLEIFGNNMLETDYIKSLISSREGHIYDRAEITKDLNNLYATGYFTQNIRAVPIKLDDGNVRLRIVVEENIPITGFTVSGNNSVSSGSILDILSELEGKPQNVITINSAIERIQELYS